MSNEILKNQFENLQHQNKERLMRIRQKASNSASSNRSEVSQESLFNESDDLGLRTNDILASASYGLNVTLEDANNKMRDEIRELKDETGRLRKILAERDYEIRKSVKKIEKLEGEKRLLADAGTGIASDAAASKIVELSKKNRELTAEMESEKSKSMQMMKRVNDLENRLKESPSPTSTTPRTKRISPRTEKSIKYDYFGASIEDLVEKLNAADLKMSEYRNQIQSLKQELKVAHKVLSAELGENTVNIQALLATDGAGYRGRTLQMNALQAKVKDLETKLAAASGSPKNRGKSDKNIERIKTMERQRKEQNDRLQDEVSAVNKANKDIQQKFDASKARNKVLTSEIKSLKSQLLVLSDKGQHDDELITTLLRQQENLQRLLEKNADKQEKEETQKTELKASREMLQLQQQDRAELERLKGLLHEKDSQIEKLQDEIFELQNQQEEENEYRPLKVFSPQKMMNDDTNRNYNIVSQSPSGEGYEELESMKLKNMEIITMLNASDIERQRLSELVQILNKRIEEMSKTEQNINKNLHDERRKAATLEHSLERLKLSNKQDGSSTAREGSSSSVGSRINQDDKLKELRTHLSIQTDENQALKEALDSTLKAKQDDIKLFSDMMQQTKSVFLEALKSLNKEKQ